MQRCTPVAFLDEKLPPRFWSKVQPCPMTGCWIWVGALSRNGYGSFTLGERRASNAKNFVMRTTHRITYAALVGEIAPGLQLDHLCRVRACCNPAHLEPVTQQENIRRGDSLSAVQTRAAACPNGHPYTPGSFYLWRDNRICRACAKVRRAKRPRKGAR